MSDSPAASSAGFGFGESGSCADREHLLRDEPSTHASLSCIEAAVGAQKSSMTSSFHDQSPFYVELQGDNGAAAASSKRNNPGNSSGTSADATHTRSSDAAIGCTATYSNVLSASNSQLTTRKRSRDGGEDLIAAFLGGVVSTPGTEQKFLPTQGSLLQPYNAGYFEQTASLYGVDPRLLFRRLVQAMQGGGLEGFMHSYARGGAPLRLFGPRGSWLRTHLQAALMHQLPPQEVMRHMNTMMIFDGVHLTLSGFAAAAVAEDAHTYAVHVPSGLPVLTAPHSSQQPGCGSSAGSSASVASADGSAGEGAAQRNKAFEFDPSDGVDQADCSLAALFSRWPHLVRLFRDSGAALSQVAQKFLQDDAAGRSVDVPEVLFTAYYQHLQLTQTCAGMWVHRPEGSHIHCVGLTTRIMNLLGFDFASLSDYVLLDSDVVSGRSVHWIHPSCLGRRAAAALDAAQRGMAAYSFEGLFMRMVGGQSGAADVPTATHYSPFYAVQTSHHESFPNGKRRMEVLYLSDVVHARTNMLQQQQVQPAKAELDALQELLQPNSTHLALQRLQRQSASPMELAAHVFSGLDAESQVRLLKRIAMLFAHRRDPLLLQHLDEGRCTAAPGHASAQHQADGPTDLNPPGQPGAQQVAALTGLDRTTLHRLHDLLEQQFGVDGLQALATGVTSASQQVPKEAVCMFADDVLRASFPFSSITAQNQRWL